MNILRSEVLRGKWAKECGLTKAMLVQWAKKSLIPSASLIGAGKGRPPRAAYPPHAVERIEKICEMRKKGIGLAKIEGELFGQHMDMLIQTFKKRGLEHTDTYLNLRKWRAMSLRDIKVFAYPRPGGRSLFNSYVSDLRFIETTYLVPAYLQVAIVGVEKESLKMKAATIMEREKLLEELVLKNPRKEGYTKVDLFKMASSYRKKRTRLISKAQELEGERAEATKKVIKTWAMESDENERFLWETINKTKLQR